VLVRGRDVDTLAPRLEPSREDRRPVEASNALDLTQVIAGDESTWRRFVAEYDPRLRAVVRHATEAIHPISDDEIDDVLGDFWLAVVANRKRMLRSFEPSRGAELMTWMAFHVARIAYDRIEQRRDEPEFVSVRRARNVPASPPSPSAKTSVGASDTVDAAIRECVRSTVVAVVREELAHAHRDRDLEEADKPRSAAWWAEHLGCSAESLVKRAKRGSLEYVKIGARYYFTQAQVQGSRRWRRQDQAHV
jgi:DNA-directed RNA polymerase specialized sigma24 family protein